jgi:proline iminopeptidase
MNTQSPLFPEITPYATEMLPVTDGHTLRVARFGNPSGIPVIALHGGPGSGFSDKSPRRFDPTLYHIICFDQRGAGESTPSRSLDANTTWHLVEDIEAIRTHLNIETWMVYGTSWGSTLALAYAQTYPDVVRALVIGGIFLGSEEELAWFNNPLGLPRLRWPEFSALQNLFGGLTGPELDKAIYAALIGTDAALAHKAAVAFALYESMACFPDPDRDAAMEYINADPHIVAHIAIELHYFVNMCFLKSDQLMTNLSRIAHIPTHIVQGALDFVCPPITAEKLHTALPNSQFTLVPMAGHFTGNALESARTTATTAMAHRLLAK